MRRIRPAKIVLNAELVAEARHLGINVEQMAHYVLRRLIEKRRISLVWEQENEPAVGAFNRYIDAHGTVGEEFRSET